MMCKQSLEPSTSHQWVFNHVTSPFSSLHKCALGWGQELTCCWLHFVCYSKAERCAVKSVCELKPVAKAPIHTAWLPLRVCSWCLFNPSFTPGSKLEVIYPCARMEQGDFCLFFSICLECVWMLCVKHGEWMGRRSWEEGPGAFVCSLSWSGAIDLYSSGHTEGQSSCFRTVMMMLFRLRDSFEQQDGAKAIHILPMPVKREEMWVGVGKTQGWACIRNLLQKVELRGHENAI